MGSSAWNSSDWDRYARKTTTKTRTEIFTQHYMHPDLDPLKIQIRESRDSDVHPCSSPIIVALDVTGSMGALAENIVKHGLGTIMGELLQRKPIPDPHLMIMAIGDMNYDHSPLQVTQFESDMAIAAQIEKIHIEGGGGGNDHESYTAAWYFAATHTVIDSWEKRQKKGYLFTVGDELCPARLDTTHIERFIGDRVTHHYSSHELLELVSQKYEVFHIIIEKGSFAKSHLKEVQHSWAKVLGQRVLGLSDHTKLAELIVSTIQIREGADRDLTAASWDGTTSLVIQQGTKNLAAFLDKAGGKTPGSIVRFK